MTTALVPATTSGSLVEGRPASKHPAVVYITRLGPGSRRGQRGALEAIARLVSSGREDVLSLDWAALRYPHVQASRLRNCAPCSRGAAATRRRRGGGTRRSSRPCTVAAYAGANSPPCASRTSCPTVNYAYNTRRAGKRGLCGSPPGAQAAIAVWLDVRGVERGIEPRPLFLAINKGGRIIAASLCGQAIERILRKRAREATVARCTPHDLRRSYISDLDGRAAGRAYDRPSTEILSER